MRKAVIPTKDDITLIYRSELAKRLGIGFWTLNRWVKSGVFPRPIQLTEAKHAWRIADVYEWLEKRARKPLPKKIRGKAATWASTKGTGSKAQHRERL